MGSSLSCFKRRKRDGAVRSVPERRPVSASELRRPNSSFSASTSLTLEPKQRKSVEAERSVSSNETVADVTEVLVCAAERLLPVAEEEVKGDDVIEKEVAVGDKRIEDIPIVGSTSDDIGDTGNIETDTTGLIDMHVRADKALVTEVSGASKVGDKALNVGSMQENLKNSLTDRVSAPGKAIGDMERKEVVGGGKDRERKNVNKGKDVKGKMKELQRSDTMLDVRSILPVKTHVTNYEKIEAEARIDPEEVVKSGKHSYEA